LAANSDARLYKNDSATRRSSASAKLVDSDSHERKKLRISLNRTVRTDSVNALPLRKARKNDGQKLGRTADENVPLLAERDLELPLKVLGLVKAAQRHGASNELSETRNDGVLLVHVKAHVFSVGSKRLEQLQQLLGERLQRRDVASVDLTSMIAACTTKPRPVRGCVSVTKTPESCDRGPPSPIARRQNVEKEVNELLNREQVVGATQLVRRVHRVLDPLVQHLGVPPMTITRPRLTTPMLLARTPMHPSMEVTVSGGKKK
jgi:hypothetical protein